MRPYGGCNTGDSQIPSRHDTGDSPAVTCPSGTSQGTVPGIMALVSRAHMECAPTVVVIRAIR
ncbi:MAG: hypothetical protein II330_07180, partial [Clostridia bacterium]|nr:hypothetical protein [Clostridia bacterium]